jgi:hypothetical protein
MTIWYILCSFGAFPVLVSFTKKNLATLLLGYWKTRVDELFWSMPVSQKPDPEMEIRVTGDLIGPLFLHVGFLIQLSWRWRNDPACSISGRLIGFDPL